ncbi:hypothetical protein CVT25_003672 [Psilocybe cyanescens]|uniref:Uncharacterized protein n=1 Tax=Psilocybe cyanescens TaxID=93625 RepID=A0A409X5Q5_PSICY|nr:hypothetical protein CVT25_003672 [Psilocybe cyanescens]
MLLRDSMSSTRSIFGSFDGESAHQVDPDGGSARSQVLGNQDLLELAFSFFDIHPKHILFSPVKLNKNYRSDSKYLLWASMTCKAFFEPAMNVLWRSVDEWMPLIKLIPTLIKQGNVYTTSRSIRQKDMQRFHVYARRIRHLQFIGSTHHLSYHIIRSISQNRQFKTFPTLQILSIPRFGSIVPENVPLLYLLPSSTLSKVSIAGVNPASEVLAASLLRAIRVESEIVTEVKLEGKLTTTSLDVIHEFRTLQTLHISIQDNGGAFPSQFLKEISETTSLKSLTLRLDSRVVFNAGEDEPLDSGPRNRSQRKSWRPNFRSTFSTLNTLELLGSAVAVKGILHLVFAPHLKGINEPLDSGPRNRSQRKSWRPNFRSTFSTLNTLELLGSAVAVKGILHLVFAPHLKGISIILANLGSIESYDIMCGCIQRIAVDMADCLESIQITSLSPGVRLPRQTLSWFHVFKRLKTMQIMVDTLPKDAISVLVPLRQWATLETLKLQVGQASLTVPPSFSLSHMTLLVMLCPTLRALAISVSLTFLREDIKSMREEITKGCSCHKLRTLELLPPVDPIPSPYCSEDAITDKSSRSKVGFSYQDIFTISRFVDHLFPCLTKMDLSQIVYTMDIGWCEDVMLTLKQLQEVRRDKHRCV